jgi:PAS domain S-box-containing protein
MIIIDLIYNLSVLVALSVLSGFIDSRYNRKNTAGKIWQGLLFGAVAIIGMLYPFNFAEGIIFDGRSIVISLCTLFFGPLAGLISSVLAIIFRIYLGGGGALTGTLVVSASYLIGAYYFQLRANSKINLTKTNLYLFGILTSIAMMVLMLTLPTSSILNAYKTISFSVMLTYPIITLVIGKILLDQEENKNSYEKIKSEETLLRTTLYSIGDGVITTDVKGNVQKLNTIAEKLTGWTEAECKGKPLEEIFKIINEETRLKVENPVEKVLREGKIVGLANHTMLISKDGTEIPIADSGAPIIAEDGKIIGVVLVFRDQTENYKNQKKLIEDEIRFRSIVEGAPDAIFVQTENRFAYLNSKACNLFGCKSKDELIGKSVIERFHPLDRDKVAERIYELNDNKHEVPIHEETIIRMDGSEVSAEFSAMPISYEGKDSALVFFRDVTERKRAEEALKESQSLYYSFIEQLPNAVFRKDLEGRYILVNSQFCKLKGLAKEEFIGKKPMEVAKREFEKQGDEGQATKYANTGEDIHEQIIKTGKTFQSEEEYLMADGSIQFMEVVRMPVYDFKRNIIGTQGILFDITNRKNAEEALRQNEEKMRMIIEGSSFFFFYTQAKSGELTYISPTVEKITGYKVDEWMKQRDWFATDNPINLDAPKRTKEHLQGKYISEPVYLEVKHKTGSVILLEIFETPIIKNGKVLGLQGIARDITERKLAEEALRQSEELLRTTLYSIGDGVITTDKFGIIQQINPVAEMLTGWTESESKGKPLEEIFKIINEETRLVVESPAAKVLREGNIVGLANHTLLVSKNGQEIPIADSGAPIKGNNDETIGVVLVFRDQTEERAKEKAIRMSEEKFRTIFENHTAVKLLVDPEDGRIVDANIAAADYYGWSQNDLKQMKIWDINVLSQNEIIKEMEKARNENKAHFEFKHRKADGIVRDVEVFSSKINIGGKEFLHSIVHDITDKKKAQEQLEQHRNHLEELVNVRTKELDEANKKLQLEIENEKEYEIMLRQALEREKELSELKSKFISTTSHEFRTPLTAVLSSAELIQRYGKNWSDDKFDYHINKIKKSIEYLTNLLDDVLTISRSESGKIVFNPVKIDLYETCRSLIDELKTHANENHNFKFLFNSEEKEFLLDPKLIRFMIVNLVSNAFKYSPEGGSVQLIIEVSIGKLIIKVSDEGIGIPKNDLQYMFEPFHRAANTMEIPGTGLGLSIVKRAVDLHGGTINLRTEENKGTTFTIYLPLNK